jgi:hypothetical protein
MCMCMHMQRPSRKFELVRRSSRMSRCVAALRRCVLDWLLDLVRDVKHEEAWAALPQRIILIRHGQAEHNLEEGAVSLARAHTSRPTLASRRRTLGQARRTLGR